MIPDEAVEAAAIATGNAPGDPVIPYDAIAEASMTIDDDAYKMIGWGGVVRILEAAAPHMLAGMYTAEEVARAFGVKRSGSAQ